MSSCYTEMCGNVPDEEVIGDCCVIERNGECIKGVYQYGGKNIVNGVEKTIVSCVSKTTNGDTTGDGKNVSVQKDDNTYKYVGVGVAALILIIVLIIIYFKYFRTQTPTPPPTVI